MCWLYSRIMAAERCGEWFKRCTSPDPGCALKRLRKVDKGLHRTPPSLIHVNLLMPKTRKNGPKGLPKVYIKLTNLSLKTKKYEIM
jgi:hypothetical protein